MAVLTEVPAAGAVQVDKEQPLVRGGEGCGLYFTGQSNLDVFAGLRAKMWSSVV